MSTHFGQKIKESWRLSGLSQKEFSEKLRMSLRNSQHLFERDDFSIQQLITISQVLNVDLVKMYLDEYTLNKDYPRADKVMQSNDIPEVKSIDKKSSNEVHVQLNIKGDFILMSRYLPEIMNTVKREVENYGLRLG